MVERLSLGGGGYAGLIITGETAEKSEVYKTKIEKKGIPFHHGPKDDIEITGRLVSIIWMKDMPEKLVFEDGVVLSVISTDKHIWHLGKIQKITIERPMGNGYIIIKVQIVD